MSLKLMVYRSWPAWPVVLVLTWGGVACSSADPSNYPSANQATAATSGGMGGSNGTGSSSTGNDASAASSVGGAATMGSAVTDGSGMSASSLTNTTGTTQGFPSSASSAVTGSGGMGTASTSTSSSMSTTGGVVVPEAPYCEPTEDWDPAWAELEQEILEIVNQVRAEGATCGGQSMPPVGPLMMDPELQCAARMHSLDMAERDFFDHDNPDGDGPNDRMRAAGYMGRGWGENIAGGSRTAEGTMDQWMNSAGHCRNIMSGDYTLIGVGYYPGGEFGHLWTQTFGG